MNQPDNKYLWELLDAIDELSRVVDTSSQYKTENALKSIETICKRRFRVLIKHEGELMTIEQRNRVLKRGEELMKALYGE